MKILWLTNVLLPEVTELLDQRINPFGGWLVNASAALADSKGINLTIATPTTENSEIKMIAGKNIDYWIFPWNKDNIKIELYEKLYKMIKDVSPDVVHIFGTEYSHSSAVVNICNMQNLKCVVSIQGLVSIYAKHYMAHLPIDIQEKSSLGDILRRNSLINQRNKYYERGKTEIEALENVSHIIGRTTWDRACTEHVNPKAEYHFCNESLRAEFYKHSWSIDDCERFSIFTSQASYPIKGIHLLLEAMPQIIKKFPETMLYIAGYDITKSKRILSKYLMPSYSRYIIKLIKDKKLEDHVIFTGLLDEKEMSNMYLKSNVFVCPSSIENSPNSLGEAMILGVPCVSSDVGGVTDMINHKEEGFVYQADAPYMLAYYISEIFKNNDLATNLSIKAKKRALVTHNIEKNTEQLISIYKNILK